MTPISFSTATSTSRDAVPARTLPGEGGDSFASALRSAGQSDGGGSAAGAAPRSEPAPPPGDAAKAGPPAAGEAQAGKRAAPGCKPQEPARTAPAASQGDNGAAQPPAHGLRRVAAADDSRARGTEHSTRDATAGTPAPSDTDESAAAPKACADRGAGDCPAPTDGAAALPMPAVVLPQLPPPGGQAPPAADLSAAMASTGPPPRGGSAPRDAAAMLAMATGTAVAGAAADPLERGKASEAVAMAAAPDASAPSIASSDPAPAFALAAAGVAPLSDPKSGSAAHPALREAHIGATVGDAAFAPALGTTLAILARDGVQQARLQLHPAEMGPITVQIAVDGASARIDFHAEVAATRQALEAALPALAGALRESGLTLTGGGVHQQAPGQRESDPGAQGTPGGRRDRSGAGAAAPAALGAIQRRGLVDLVA